MGEVRVEIEVVNTIDAGAAEDGHVPASKVHRAVVECVVGPPTSEALLGQIPLEAMDLLVDRNARKLTPRPESPYLPTLKLK